MNERVKSLKKRTIPKSSAWEEGNEAAGYRDDVWPDLYRARYYTDAYKENDGAPEVIRRARALKGVLEESPVYIKEGELIVGAGVWHPRALINTIELTNAALQETVDDGYVRPEDKEEMLDLIGYWGKRNMWSRIQEIGRLDEATLYSNRSGITGLSLTTRDGYGTCAPDYEFVFKKGYKGIIDRMEGKIEEASQPDQAIGPQVKENVSKIYQWQAMQIAARAAIDWGKRHAELARFMAAEESDAARKQELLKIAEVCDRCLEYPVDSFQGAVQAHWFIQLLTHQIERFAVGTSVRLDQILYPYYKLSVEEKKETTREEALEMIECLWIKEVEGGYVNTRLGRRNWQGAFMLQIYTIGGVDANGRDACNEITKLMIEATGDTRSTQPSFCLRMHSQVPDEYLKAAFEGVKTGMAIPSFENDSVVIPSLMEQFGYTLEEARSWALILCKSPGATGPKGTPRRRPCSLNCLGPLSIALNGGVDVMSGIKMGPESKPEGWKTMEEVYEGYRAQVAAGLKIAWHLRNLGYEIEAEYLQQPFLSCCYEPYIEKGVDCMEYDPLPSPWFNAVGIVDAGDSLSAIKKLIFESKKYTMAELCDALRKNWEGQAEMKQDFLNAPKWGNDDDFADEVIIKTFDIVVEEGLKVKDRWGASPRPLPQALTGFRGSGFVTGATPNGRKAGEVLSDGGTSPYHGCDRKGPTAVLRSVSKLDHTKLRASLLNQRLQPAMLQGEKGWQMFRAYIKTWHDLMIEHVQINVVDNAVLKSAQKAPEKYPDLVVRVAGYSAYFTQLDKGTQDSIIARTEQVLV